MKNLKFAVVGKDVSQSSSPAMHTFIAKKFGKNIVYENISVPPEEFKDRAEYFFKNYTAFNVTIPFKLDVIPFLSSLEGDAATFGAVRNNGVEAAGKTVLLLGAGGAGRSAAKKLKDCGAEVFVYDKNPASSAAVAEEFGVTALAETVDKPYDIIINATGIGMHKTVGMSPVGKGLISLCNTAVDLIYVPPKSAFLEIAEACGKKIVNGVSMLFYQAYYAECIYFDRRPQDEEAKELFNEYSKGVRA